MLSVHNLSFAYGHKVVLKDINFSIQKGDCLVILGHNGAGKSTLLKTLNHLLKANTGSVIMNHQNIKDMTPIKRAQKIAYVPQSLSFHEASVFDTVLLGRKPYMSYRVSDDDLIKTDQIIKALNLDEIAFDDMTKLSGGQRQKVAIARALNQETELLLLDEPTANLDLKNQLELTEFMKHIAQNHDKTMIVTMHDLNLALRFGNKFLFLKDQQVYEFGTGDIITEKLIKDIYQVDVKMIEHDFKKHMITL